MAEGKPDIWMPFYVADYLSDTMHLSPAEHGGYLMLILHYWKSGPIPDDDSRLAIISRMGDAWSNASSTIRAFFKHRDGMLTHTRIDKEKLEATDNKERNRVRAKLAADKRWGNDAKSNATSMPQAMLPECPSPSPSHIKLSKSKIKEKTEFLLPDWIPKKSWDGYLDMRQKKKKVPTARAVELLIIDLEKLKNEGQDVGAVLDKSTVNSWTGVFAIKLEQQFSSIARPEKFDPTAYVNRNKTREPNERTIEINEHGEPV